MKTMIDIHSHIIYGTDDGAPTIEETEKMIRKARDHGVTTIIATPHYQENIFTLEGVQNRFPVISKKAKEYGIDMKLGCEVYINPFIDRLVLENKFLLLNQADYILLELPYESIPLYTYDIIYKLQLQRISIIIAHPERNLNLITDFTQFSNILKRGCMMQVEAGSIVGAYGATVEEFAKKLIKLRMVHFVASDAHCAKDYDDWYLKAYKRVHRWVGSEYTDKLFTSNPQLILDNDRSSIYSMI